MARQSANSKRNEQYHYQMGILLRQFALADASVTDLLLKALKLEGPAGAYLAYGMGLQVRQRKLVHLIKTERVYPEILLSLIDALVNKVADFRDKLVHWPSIVMQGTYTQFDSGRNTLKGKHLERVLSLEDLQEHSRWLDLFNMDVSLVLDDPRRPPEAYMLWQAPAEELPQWWGAYQAKLGTPPQRRAAPPQS